MLALAGCFWLATGGAAVSYLIWFRGVARLPVARVSLLGLVSPVVATIAGLVVLDVSDPAAPQVISDGPNYAGARPANAHSITVDGGTFDEIHNVSGNGTATIMLMGTGLLGLVAYSRKRFRQKS